MNRQKISQAITLDVYVKPKSKEFKIEKEDDRFAVFCRESPVKGRVNRELIKELSRLFKRRVEIISGFSSRKKRVLIQDIDMNEIRQVLDATTAQCKQIPEKREKRLRDT